MKQKILAVFICCTSLQLAAQNLVPNPQFELLQPSTKAYTFHNPQMDKNEKTCNDFGNPLFRYSPAQYWTIWLGGIDCRNGVMTELVNATSNCVPRWPNYVMKNMMHVKTTSGGMGIVNTAIPGGTAPARITCWVYVIKGKVDFAYGFEGTGFERTYSTTTCKWERLEIIKKGPENCNQITVYSFGADAEFYIDAVSVEKIVK